jgi:hypothetical protein
MSRKSPAVALLWMYAGKDPEARRKQIEEWNYPKLAIVKVDRRTGWNHAVQDVAPQTDICIFWLDDDKPVGRDFLSQMTRPLTSGGDFSPVMHFWSGNAISVLKKTIDSSPLRDDYPGSSLLSLLVPMLDHTDKGPSGRVHLALSSIERLAPLSMEPVGFPS